jgi:UvrB/uvrC motif
MSYDLTQLLHEWPYQSGQLAVRIVEGEDNAPKIQMRLDLGLIQMEMDGRPDGQRVEGFESYLDLIESTIDESSMQNAPPDSFELSPEDCKKLREEAVQYYQRYVALFVLEEFDGVVRDTSRNLRVLDLCHDYAADDNDRLAIEQFRPYIIMMRARALAVQAIGAREPKAAMLYLDRALVAIKSHMSEQGLQDQFEDSSEVQLLQGMRDALVPKLPLSPKAELRNRLRQAIEHENYELAAILRDELKNMPD